MPSNSLSLLPLGIFGLVNAAQAAPEQPSDPPSNPAPAESSGPSAAAGASSADIGQANDKGDESNQLYGGRAWAISLIAGYYAPTETTWGLDVNPFSAGFGGTISWTSPIGVWLGVHGQYFLGKGVDQSITPIAGFSYDFTSTSSLLAVGGTVGFDFSLGPVVMRHSLEIGASIQSWDFGDLPYLSFGYFPSMKGTGVSMYLAPGVGLMIPLGPVFLGPELRYRIEFTGRIPDAIGGQLQAGVRF